MNTWQAGKRISETEIRVQPGKSSWKINVKIPTNPMEVVTFYDALAAIFSKGFYRVSGYKGAVTYYPFTFPKNDIDYFCSDSKSVVITWAKALLL